MKWELILEIQKKESYRKVRVWEGREKSLSGVRGIKEKTER